MKVSKAIHVHCPHGVTAAAGMRLRCPALLLCQKRALDQLVFVCLRKADRGPADVGNIARAQVPVKETKRHCNQLKRFNMNPRAQKLLQSKRAVGDGQYNSRRAAW